MPEASIDKDRDSLAVEKEIWPPRQANVAPPACDAIFSKDTNKLNFRVAIAPRANRCHNSRPN
jgi:hypothetical protein